MLDSVLAACLGVVIGLLIGFVYFLIWKARHTGTIRQDAVQRSQAVTVGKVTEQLLPYLPGFRFNPKDARFLGSPVDLVVFDGLAEGELRGIWFLEVKTGNAVLSARERQIRDAILEKRVGWDELRLPRG
ncbi:MAG TPA: Holliday junction resolvase-like protein [Gemmatimonadales bacterium]|nr:Holliday junction resolvase-like protein [Gemmatimonadales bacterium]